MNNKMENNNTNTFRLTPKEALAVTSEPEFLIPEPTPEPPKQTAEDEAKDLNESETNIIDSPNLRLVLETSKKLKEAKASDIRFSEPILKQGDNAVIFPHTINVIQGQAGVHKSRLAEFICAAFLKTYDCKSELLGFKRTNYNANHCVIYVDTERNLSEQLPYALQSIQLKAGYEKTEHPANFQYISLLQIKRSERFKTLNEYLNYMKQRTNSPMFIVLDVSTDCIEDFNKTADSMELIDLMNIAINEHYVVFLCLIHENPNSDKARGHFGTELMNKASTVIRVGFEKDSNQENTDIIRAKYLKCRSTAKHQPFHFKYCQDSKGLVLVGSKEADSLIDSRKKKASNEDVIEMLETYLTDNAKMPRAELIKMLTAEFNASPRTIEDRLKEIHENEDVILNSEAEPCRLNKVIIDKVCYYELLKTQ